MQWRFLIGLGLTLIVGGRTAFAGSPAGFRLVARTSHASYYAGAKAKVDVDRSEKFLERLDAVFGPPPDGWHVDYFRHPDRAGVEARSGRRALGVTDLTERRIDSALDFHPHELVHSVAGRLGVAPVFLAEGLAVALSSGGRWGGRPVDHIAAEAAIGDLRLQPFLERFEEQDPDLAYPVAGSFVAYLIDTFGIEPVISFYAATAEGVGIETASRRTFGRSLAGLNLMWVAALRDTAREEWEWKDSETWPGSLRRSAPAIGNPSRVTGGSEIARAQDGAASGRLTLSSPR